MDNLHELIVRLNLVDNSGIRQTWPVWGAWIVEHGVTYEVITYSTENRNQAYYILQLKFRNDEDKIAYVLKFGDKIRG